MITKTHHYFLLNLNPWPLLSSIWAFNLLFSLSLFFKFSVFFNFLLSLIFLTLISFSWWLNYKKEFDYTGLVSWDLEEGLKISMILFISSEVFFFFSFFWSYFHFYLSPGLENGFMWPPQGVESFDPSNVPLLNTLILLSSGILVTVSHTALMLNLNKMSSNFLFFTIFLGLIFTLCQLQEYHSSFFCLNDSNFGTAFFMLTGFHGIHVLIGTMFLSLTLIFSFMSKNSNSNFVSFELACWYWHFVDVVWIFLFFFLYYLNI